MLNHSYISGIKLFWYWCTMQLEFIGTLFFRMFMSIIMRLMAYNFIFESFKMNGSTFHFFYTLWNTLYSTELLFLECLRKTPLKNYLYVLSEVERYSLIISISKDYWSLFESVQFFLMSQAMFFSSRNLSIWPNNTKFITT